MLVIHDYLEGTIALRNQLEEGFIVLAERLKRIRDERLYEGEYSDFDEFLVELHISRSTAYKIVSVFEKFVLLGEIEPAKVAEHGWGTLCLFAGRISSKDEAKAVFERISHLSRGDALKELVELKSGREQKDCAHEWQELHIRQCLTCGVKEKVYEND